MKRDNKLYHCMNEIKREIKCVDEIEKKVMGHYLKIEIM